MRLIYLLILFFLQSHLLEAQTNIKIDEKAPRINITNWIANTPLDTDLEGKFIVLEFWATWCGPCIEAVPHMNMLRTEITNKDLYFISITDESERKVKNTLKRVDFNSIVVSDTTKQTQIQFGDGKKGLGAFPMTVLIDNEGYIKWIGRPTSLTKPILTEFLNKTLTGINLISEENNTSEQEKASAAKDEVDVSTFKRFVRIINNPKQLLYFEIAKTSPKVEFNIKSDKSVAVSPITLRQIYFDYFGEKVAPSAVADSKYYSFMYKNVKGGVQDIHKIEDILISSLGLKREVKKETIVKYTVEVVDQSKLTPAEESMFSSKSDAGKKILFSNYTLGNMLKEVGKVLEVPLIYDGKNTTNYDFIIDIKNIKKLKKCLASYGLSLEEKNTEGSIIHLSKK